MHQTRSIALICLLTLACTAAEAATRIYKTVDKDGNVVFTDTPPPNRTDPVDLKQTNEYSPEVSNQRGTDRRVPPPVAGEEEPDDVVPFSYESIKLVSPEADLALRDNAGNVTVSVSLSPGLRQGDTLEVLLDGKVVASGAQTEVQLENVDRGSHEVAARVVDKSGNTAIRTEPSTFHLLRYSALQRKAPPPRRAN
ncbi:MAG: DUF4124 domain-containing protein [Pseudomonadales bacterium]